MSQHKSYFDPNYSNGSDPSDTRRFAYMQQQLSHPQRQEVNDCNSSTSTCFGDGFLLNVTFDREAYCSGFVGSCHFIVTVYKYPLI